MKNFLNKIKLGLPTLRLTIISFFSKVIGQSIILPWWWNDMMYNQSAYWIEHPVDIQDLVVYGPKPSKTTMAQILQKIGIINIRQRVLVVITFIIWIVSFFRIRKTKNKTQKKKRTKISIIIISVLLIILIESIIYKFVD